MEMNDKTPTRLMALDTVAPKGAGDPGGRRMARGTGRRYGIAVLVLVVAVALAPPATAGTEADPEIDDAAGDATMPVSAALGSQEALDLVAVWIEEANDELAFNWKVVALASPGAAERLEYNVDFEVNGTQFVAQIWRQKADSVFGGGIWGLDGAPCAHTSDDLGVPATFQWDEQTEVLSFVTSASFLAGCPSLTDRALQGAGSLTDLSAFTFHCVMARGNTCNPESIPDEAGPGRDFVFASNATSGANDTLPGGAQVSSPGPGLGLVLVALGVVGALAGGRRRDSARR